MIEVGDLVKVKVPSKKLDTGRLALVIASDYKGEVHAIRFLDNDQTVNFHHSRLEKL